MRIASWVGNRRTAGIGIVLASALLVGACGGDDDDSTGATGDEGTEESSGTSAETGPITIEHSYGETTLDAPPERIVSLDTQWTDVLTALDAPLVGAAVLGEGGGEPLPWQELGDDVELLPVTDGIPYEAVAGLTPDLIVITYGAVEEADYERLSEIAPTIPLLGEEDVDPWEDIAAAAGEILGAPDDAAALVAEAEEMAADLRAELPGLEGRTVAFANYVPGDVIYVLTNPGDGANVFFTRLGLELDPELVGQDDQATGRMELSLEHIDQLDSDFLALLTNDADPDDIPGYANLPAVQDGAVTIMEMDTAIALNTPTPLSLPYALEQIRPALEAAAE